ncbi:MAG: NAD-dependent epimerase/dehydratase family protein [Calditrichaeota bacterium]|nr:MAG: NAD-dependent epimerase/dehydratase family protein [Calditrichota bacterium]MBL1204614.1 NAD-dependent epimerase/dehydratase family protein [Calditrichota bacterium]NOG44443.1 NAD-dependent epimerase/dehydratase family protein [Calditrichota bacterium]
MNILVTGGAGFIGSNLVDKLLDLGHRVSVIDSFSPFYDISIKRKNLESALKDENFSLYEIDVRDSENITEIFELNVFDVVIHLASKAGVRPSIRLPRAYFDVNVNGTLNILEECRRHNISKVVYASSSSVYGNNKNVPFKETDTVDFPISPYAASKKAGELICHNYHHLYGINIFALRFFTVYGRRNRPDMGMYKFCKAIDEGKKIQLYGNGEPRRDFTHVDDIIDGIIKSIQHVNGFEILNLGESKTISVNELITLFEQKLGKKAITEKIGMQPGDVMETYADISKAKNLIGYDPKTTVEAGVDKLVDWYLKEK